ncbi:MAG: M23 family metallopeptidase [Oscillatoriales cyanobacterium RM1_1_9]|nr:M23 family metallopeptidase [Oscillatoriales cyanobacterium SM2_3_0]NJO45869.1 M23 family metallopeptidase [Oscillatoriales cyanobacterium RM2_1_1]NJO72092.1 M23 family metallopeptidase [Oscillatoriales cyanobacterium RM1_1_9]
MINQLISGLTPKAQFRSGKALLMASLMSLGGFSLGWQKLVEARESIQATSALSWSEASFPVENFQEYTSPFGYRSSGFHYGLDMAAPQGSYIRNWWTGTVVEVWEDGRCGTGIAIDSGQWTHIYCHVQGSVAKDASGRTYFIDRQGGIQLWEGQVVASGARIARVGMTGRTTGPHLHWGLKYSGRWVDPGRVLMAMYNEQNQRYSRR